MSQNCVILNTRTLSKRAAREARKAREARDALLARERASERESDREYVGAGKEEDARRRATGYLSLPVSYSAGGPGGGEGRGGGVPTSTPVVRFLLLFTYYFLDLKNYFSTTRDPSCKLN